MAKERVIREEPSVTEQIDRLCKHYSRIKEFWDGIKWRLSREPERGYKFASERDEFVYKIEGPNEFFPHGIKLRYKYTDGEIIILDIRIIPVL